MLPINLSQVSKEYQKARAHQRAGRLKEAQAIFLSLAEVAPDIADIHFQIGRIHKKDGKIAEAIARMERAWELNPKETLIETTLANFYTAGGRFDDARAIYDRQIAADPKNPMFRVEKAYMHRLAGEFGEAEKELNHVLKIDPLRGETYRMLSTNRKIAPGDPFIGKMRKVLKNPKLSDSARVDVNFSMAKAMEDTGQYDKVFRYLKPGNAAMKKHYGYRVATRRAEIDGLIRAFSAFDFTPVRAPDESFAPIFVTGLPRSGTTLVEQILGSHSEVTAGGEMVYALRQAYEMIGFPERGFTDLSRLAPERFQAYADSYQKSVRGSVSFDRVVTDKAIQSHLIIGLLKYVMPSARVIVVRRDPRDNLYSIYKNHFMPGTHKYSYDLEDLAAYYASFIKILDFWREKLPGAFHEIYYEELVNDPEPQARALVAAAGLDWEDGCLDFHKSKGLVRTLSVQQVRQPIYKSSTRAWQRYETELQPLFRALEREGVELT